MLAIRTIAFAAGLSLAAFGYTGTAAAAHHHHHNNHHHHHHHHHHCWWHHPHLVCGWM
jgi:hypothetical protein